MSGGYPDRGRWTPLPDLFFSRDLPALADPVALKLLLHLLWRCQRRQPGDPGALRRAEIPADPPLRRGVAALGLAEAAIGGAIEAALDALVAGGSLIEVAPEGPAGPERWVLPNTREGRSQARRLAEGRGVPAVETAPAPPEAPAGPPPTIYALYEANIGVLTPMLAETLRDAEASYPAPWIEDAIRLAVENNRRSWAYVRAILERWAREGRKDDAPDRRDRGALGRGDREGPYAAYIEH